MIFKRLVALHWSLKLVIFAVLGFAGLCIFALVNALGTATQPVAFHLEKHPADPRRLVVLVHGWTEGSDTMKPVSVAAIEGGGAADILTVSWPSRIFSKTDPCRMAAEIEARIVSADAEKPYDEIVLCGFSSGALLIRKAYVYGCGRIEDHPGSHPTALTTAERKPWVDKVGRIVLLAGMNRGASIDERGKNMGLSLYYLNKLAFVVAKTTGTGTFALQCLKGAPFVANLRLQWLEARRQAVEGNRRVPTVVQLLGDQDDVVSPADSRDVAVARDFIWVPVVNTGHRSMLHFDGTFSGQERLRKTTLAFGDDKAIERLKRESPATTLEEDPLVETVVFVLHGIRDMGEWTSQFTKPLQESYARLNAGAKTKLVVFSASYGYFGMGPFLLGTDRQENVRWFMDQVTEPKAKYPNMKNLHFIGHSNGTYVLGSALQRYVTLHVNRVVLAGSVLPRDYPWSALTGRVEGVRNYVGHDDVVVALGPKVFEMPGFSMLNKDIGSAGYDGFTDGMVTATQLQFVPGGHSAALRAENVQSIVDFIAEGKLTESPIQITTTPRDYDTLSNLAWLVWIVAAVALVILGIYLPRLIAWIAARIRSAPSPAAYKRRIIYARVAYVAVLFFILTTY